MTPLERQALLAHLAATLDTMRGKECTGRHKVPAGIKQYQCTSCGEWTWDKAGAIPDPQAQAAWEVVTVECQVCSGDGKARRQKPGGFALAGAYYEVEVTDGPCEECEGTGRTPWNISEPPWPDGAVWGMLEQAVVAVGFEVYSQVSVILGGTEWVRDDPEALMAAFQTALEARKA